MKHLRRNILMLLAALFLALVCIAPVMAQDVTATADPQPVVTQPVPDGNITVSAFELLGIVVTAVLSGSLTTFAGVVAFIRAFRDPEKMALIEGLYNSQPVERKTPIRKGVELLKESAEILDEATDGVPAVSKVGVRAEPPERIVAVYTPITSHDGILMTGSGVSTLAATQSGDDPHPTPEKP